MKLIEGPPRKRFSQSITRYVVIGALACVLLVFGVGGWAAVARLNSAVIAGGHVVVASNVKRVQHPDGGIVGEIYVKNGDTVKAGQLLIRLDETLVKANRDIVDSQLVALEARLARLRAERDGADEVPVPAVLADRMDEPEVRQAIESERKVFAARRDTISGQVDRLTERIGQLRQQIDGYEAQREAKQREIDLIQEELVDLEALFAKGHVPKTRIMALKREAARLEGEHGELTSQMAVSASQVSETELEILQLKRDFAEKVFSEITELEPKIANLKERRAAADFQLKRMDIRAPYDGFVHELSVHTVGGVIQPGQTIMQIVPEADQLVIEARVAPTDVDEVMVDHEANVVLTAFDTRTTPTLHGRVVFKSADISQDEKTGLVFFVVRVALDDGELDRLGSDKTVTPGMPAEVFIQTGARTVINYLIEPLTEQIRRTFRES